MDVMIGLKNKTPEEMWDAVYQVLDGLKKKGVAPLTIDFSGGDAHFQKPPTLKIEFPFMPQERKR